MSHTPFYRDWYWQIFTPWAKGTNLWVLKGTYSSGQHYLCIWRTPADPDPRFHVARHGGIRGNQYPPPDFSCDTLEEAQAASVALLRLGEHVP